MTTRTDAFYLEHKPRESLDERARALREHAIRVGCEIYGALAWKNMLQRHKAGWLALTQYAMQTLADAGLNKPVGAVECAQGDPVRVGTRQPEPGHGGSTVASSLKSNEPRDQLADRLQHIWDVAHGTQFNFTWGWRAVADEFERAVNFEKAAYRTLDSFYRDHAKTIERLLARVAELDLECALFKHDLKLLTSKYEAVKADRERLLEERVRSPTR
jgi:hypothetical protein